MGIIHPLSFLCHVLSPCYFILCRLLLTCIAFNHERDKMPFAPRPPLPTPPCDTSCSYRKRRRKRPRRPWLLSSFSSPSGNAPPRSSSRPWRSARGSPSEGGPAFKGWTGALPQARSHSRLPSVMCALQASKRLSCPLLPSTLPHKGPARRCSCRWTHSRSSSGRLPGRSGPRRRSRRKGEGQGGAQG